MSAEPPPPPAGAWEREQLWLGLRALGLEPEKAALRVSSSLALGPDMFDKPNKDAFTVVAHFLFSKLDQSRCNEIFRFCFPPADKKADSEFRKHSYEWLRRISDECGNDFPPVVASLFFSPGGSKFIHLMYSFARYVVMQDIKVLSADAEVPYAEALNDIPEDLNIAVAKYQVAQNKFLRALQRQDSLNQEFQKKAQHVIKQIRDLKSENADLDKQIEEMEKAVNAKKSNTAERLEKVRCLWTQITETLTSLQKEIEVVDSVVKGHIDQYVLDATSVAINVPRPLLEKVEKDMHQFHVGNVYEEGKLNVIAVIHLLNKALEILVHERWLVDKNALELDLQYMEGKTKYQNINLQDLKSLRQKLEHEALSIKQSISEKQQEWDLKWENCLGQPPFHFNKNPDPAFELLPAMSPLSFSPATEEAYKSSVFCQYPASIPDSTRKNFKETEFETADKVSGCQGSSAGVTAERMAVPSSSLVAAPENETLASLEEGLVPETPKLVDHSRYQRLRYEGRNSRPAKAIKKQHGDTFKTPSSVKREDPLKKAQDQLAEQMADVVASNSPQGTQGGGQELEDLFGTVISDPFSAKKQIPRTPENLLTEIRGSWKNAVQDEKASSVEQNHTEAIKDIPLDQVPVPRNQIDLSMRCFMSSCMSDTAESAFLEAPSPFCFQRVVTGYSELPANQAAAGPTDEVFWKPGSADTTPGKCERTNRELGLKTEHASEPEDGPRNGIAAETLPPYGSQNSSMSTTVSWDGLPIGSGPESQEVVQLGILQETLPEEGTPISLNNRCNNFELGEVREDGNALPGCVPGSERQLDLQSIQRRFEMLKKTMLENSLCSREQIPRCRSELSLSPVSLEAHNVLSPSGKPYASDAELARKPLHATPLERKVLLSPLGSPSSAAQREQRGSQDRGGLLNR